MLKIASYLVLALVSVSLLIGCGGSGTTAVEVVESYGILNQGNSDPEIASIIQSGQADTMIASGQAKIRHRAQGSGDRRILVSEYLIHGEVYRVEVRRAVNPMLNIELGRIRYGESVQGPVHGIINGWQMMAVYNCLRDDSYEARPAIAYRAWEGVDGKTRGVVIEEGEAPQWTQSQNDLSLLLRTKDWPVVMMWFRGLTSDTRRAAPTDDFVQYNANTFAVAAEGQGVNACDGRWIMESPGPGVQVVPFINMELYEAMAK